jgi:hypothetical protein
LETVAPPERLPALQRQRELLLAAVGETVVDDRDAAFALVADRQGIGVTAGGRRDDAGQRLKRDEEAEISHAR